MEGEGGVGKGERDNTTNTQTKKDVLVLSHANSLCTPSMFAGRTE